MQIPTHINDKYSIKEWEWTMHYLTLITAEIPEITEDEQTNEAVKAQIDKL